MQFGTLINNILVPAPRRIEVGEVQIYNPPDEQYIALGYLPVIYVEAPEPPEGYYCVDSWEEQQGQIVQVWHFEELPPDDPGASEILEIILGGAVE